MPPAFFSVVNAESGKIIASKVRIAETFKSRSIGLLDRSSIAEEEGLLIKPCNSIHTFFMKFPIDAIFLNKDNIVVKVVHGIPAWRLSGAMLRGFMVLELKSGTATKYGIVAGNKLNFVKNKYQ